MKRPSTTRYMDPNMFSLKPDQTKSGIAKGAVANITHQWPIEVKLKNLLIIFFIYLQLLDKKLIHTIYIKL